MTTNPPGEEHNEERPSGELHTCYNCFADFSWEPTYHDGEEFCCAGCVEGGPCICTYEGPPQTAEEPAEPTAVASGADVDEDEEIAPRPEREGGGVRGFQPPATGGQYGARGWGPDRSEPPPLRQRRVDPGRRQPLSQFQPT